jgi:hypothetical protein
MQMRVRLSAISLGRAYRHVALRGGEGKAKADT